LLLDLWGLYQMQWLVTMEEANNESFILAMHLLCTHRPGFKIWSIKGSEAGGCLGSQACKFSS
jgi:hypothetical protein